MLYVGGLGTRRQMILDPFQNKYGIHIESMAATSSLLAPKIAAERRAGMYSGDVCVSGGSTYITLKDFIDKLEPALMLPDLTEPELIQKTWYGGILPWANNAQTMLVPCMTISKPICINTNLVKPGEVADDRDLLNPKWKGKMSIYDPRLGGNGLYWFAVSLEMGDLDVNYMRELSAKQQLTFSRDNRQQAEWLAQGKHAIAIGGHTATMAEFMQLGAPIDRFYLGTPFTTGASSGTAVFNRGPHPNAAKVFVNWLLSQEGQTFLAAAGGGQSWRLDVSTDHLTPSDVLKPGVKIFRTDNEDFSTKKDSYYVELAKDVFGR